jgi:hypothetical protein
MINVRAGYRQRPFSSAIAESASRVLQIIGAINRAYYLTIISFKNILEKTFVTAGCASVTTTDTSLEITSATRHTQFLFCSVFPKLKIRHCLSPERPVNARGITRNY